MKKKPLTKTALRRELSQRKQGSPGAAPKVFGQPARGVVKGYVPN